MDILNNQQDDDCDGLIDECDDLETDTDDDGTPDCFDLCPDDKNKISTGVCGCGTPDADENDNGITDCVEDCAQEYDSDGDGICDRLDRCVGDDATGDSDGDGYCNDVDTDDDGDGLSDDQEDLCFGDDASGDEDHDGRCNDLDTDDDSDGWIDQDEIDCGSDPLSFDSVPADADSDKICDPFDSCFGDNASGDLDSDGDCDDFDLDDDADGWLDTEEKGCGSDPRDAASVPEDSDLDQVCDVFDQCIGDDSSNDTDSDGECNDIDVDDDGDTWLDSEETVCGSDPLLFLSIPLDDDGDHICDLVDPCYGDNTSGDTDGDSQCNDVDTDDDNDTWSDMDEVDCGTDPLLADSAPADHDGDHVCDMFDQCDGNDLAGNTDGDTMCDDVDTDDDNDTWSDAEELACGTNPLLSSCVPIDTDGDRVCDPLDQCTGDDASGNTDGDQQCNDLDTDDDDDGWSDSDEEACGTDPLRLISVPGDSDADGICDPLDQCLGNDGSGDTDSDGECNDVDIDDDGDGWSDSYENMCGSDPLVLSSVPVDDDGDGTPNCSDGCSYDPSKTEPGLCGCGILEGTCPTSLEEAHGLTTGITNFGLSSGPVQLYVDSDYDGGGWILVGRGRENWSWTEDGMDDTNTLANGLGTSAAFSPAYLPTTMIQELISNAGIDLTWVEIRIKRAADTSGSNFQETRWRAKNRTDWTWLLPSAQYAIDYRVFDSVLGAGTSQSDDSRDAGSNDHRRTFTWNWSGHNYKAGFSYGIGISGGTNDANNFFWQNATEKHSIPYSEVYIRSIEFAQSCADILNDKPSAADGIYTIDPDGPEGNYPIPATCDMTTLDGGWTLISHVRKESSMPYPGCQNTSQDPETLGYSINASGISFSQIAITHNGLSEGEFAVFNLAEPSVFDCNQQDRVYLQDNGRYSILSLSAASSGGWGDIPLVCINASNTDCRFESRSLAYGAVATGTGNCQQLNDDSTGDCGAWGLAPNIGDATWSNVGGKILIR